MGTACCHDLQVCAPGRPGGLPREPGHGAAGGREHGGGAEGLAAAARLPAAGRASSHAEGPRDLAPAAGCEALGARGLRQGLAAARSLPEAAPEVTPTDVGQAFALAHFSQEEAELKDVRLWGGGPLLRTPKRHEFASGAVYDGQWHGNERDGWGSMRWPDGSRYEGEWRSNKATGKGRFRHVQGDAYCGEWTECQAHGNGVFRKKDGTVYFGQFADDLMHGYGEELWPDKSRFAGEFVRGQKSGHGVYHWPEGSEYAGQWRDNKIDGIGRYRGKDGRQYSGLWSDGQLHGCGRYTWANGQSFAGQYARDEKSGYGVFTWKDGRRYEGFWADGMQHDAGKLCSPTHGARMAKWNRGKHVRWLDLPEDPSGIGSGAPEVAGRPPPAGR